MTSSTSLSNQSGGRKLPPRLLLVLAVAVGAWILSAVYTLLWNPEITLFKHAAEVKLGWSHRLDQQFTNKTVIFGGSSSTFSVDAGYALRAHRAPIANLALGAGMGAKVLTRFALPELRRGDTLLMMLEPGLLHSDLDPTQLGTQFSIAIKKPAYAHPSAQLTSAGELPWRNYLTALRPGGYHFFTLLGKLLRGQPLYRYTPADFDESGHQQTSAKAPLVTPRGQVILSADSKAWLTKLRAHCAEAGVELIYALPWAFCPDTERDRLQKENAAFLLQVQEFMPVLREPRLGAHPVAAHFADTSFHLTKEGAVIRTSELITSLRSRSFWTASELKGI